jgi:CO/xanthine dehydrogenase FAD-binding subunit
MCKYFGVSSPSGNGLAAAIARNRATVSNNTCEAKPKRSSISFLMFSDSESASLDEEKTALPL